MTTSLDMTDPVPANNHNNAPDYAAIASMKCINSSIFFPCAIYSYLSTCAIITCDIITCDIITCAIITVPFLPVPFLPVPLLPKFNIYV